MTIQELRDLLEQYPDDAQVYVIQEREPGTFSGTMMDVKVSWSIDQDTGEGAVCLWPILRTEKIQLD